MEILEKEFVGRVVRSGDSLKINLPIKLFRDYYRIKPGDILIYKILDVKKGPELKKEESK